LLRVRLHRDKAQERDDKKNSAIHNVCPAGLFDGIGRQDILSEQTRQAAKSNGAIAGLPSVYGIRHVAGILPAK
jgi:hypothetical protein